MVEVYQSPGETCVSLCLFIINYRLIINTGKLYSLLWITYSILLINRYTCIRSCFIILCIIVMSDLIVILSGGVLLYYLSF